MKMPTATLRDEHVLILRALDALESAADRLERGDAAAGRRTPASAIRPAGWGGHSPRGGGNAPPGSVTTGGSAPYKAHDVGDFCLDLLVGKCGSGFAAHPSDLVHAKGDE
jgi:hypothetical protein